MLKVNRRFHQRATACFQRCERQIDAALDIMLSKHASAGRLQSGNTIIQAVRIFEEETSKALASCLEEAAKMVDHRGWRWSRAMEAIGLALEDHLAKARAILANPIRIADGRQTPSIQNAADVRIAESSGRLRDQIADFREGWTAPLPKVFKDRHPFFYAVLLLVIGAAIGLASSMAKNVFARSNPAEANER